MSAIGSLRYRRGTAVLLATIIFVAGLSLVLLSPVASNVLLSVRIGVIDSGIDMDQDLMLRTVAQRSFISISNGYSSDDISTVDSRPNGTRHGTNVARIVIQSSPNAVIVNAKVVSEDNTATPWAISEAVQWCVEEGCTVINLSIGGPHILHDPVVDAIRYAHKRGVSVVAAVGNAHLANLALATVKVPATMLEVISVAAVDENLHPYDWSVQGPLRDGSLKPDVSAPGFYVDNQGRSYGTSFAAPRVTSAVVSLITLCVMNGWRWSPGMVKAAVLAGARPLQHPEYLVGQGLIDPQASAECVRMASRRDGLPLLSYVTPRRAPYQFERWFTNSTYSVRISVFSSSLDSWNISYVGPGSEFVVGPSQMTIDQTASFELRVEVPVDFVLGEFDVGVFMASRGYSGMYTRVSFTPHRSIARIAFDTSRSSWQMDSIYGQFRLFYGIATSLGISVEEIREEERITFQLLSRYDAVIVLDPCSKVISYGSGITTESLYYTLAEIQAYLDYYRAGGSLFIVVAGAGSTSVVSVNQLLGAFNASLTDDSLPPIRIVVNGIDSTMLIYGTGPHPVTLNVMCFDYLGSTLNYSSPLMPIAWATVTIQDAAGVSRVNKTVMVAGESGMGGRLLITGSNYFLDNFGLSDVYHSITGNYLLVRQILQWLAHLS
ncbi:MAG: S8 family serine peptidase [Candidatus Thorarchaeota archaeon]